MVDFYGHHPSEDVADPNDYYTIEEVNTLVETVSANLDEHSELKGLTIGNDHTQYYLKGEVDLLSMEASANAYNNAYNDAVADSATYTETVSAMIREEVNNGWLKDYTFFTTITSAAPSAAFQIDAVPGNLLVKADIVGIGGIPPETHAAYTLQAFFKWDFFGPPTWQKVGSTTVLFEEEDDNNWFADIVVDPGGLLINVEVQGFLVEWIVTVEWLMQPAPPP